MVLLFRFVWLQPRVFRDDEIGLLAQHLQKMELMSIGIGKRIRGLADCELFYWHKSLLDTYLSEAHHKHFESSRLEYVLAAVYDCKSAILQVISNDWNWLLFVMRLLVWKRFVFVLLEVLTWLLARYCFIIVSRFIIVHCEKKSFEKPNITQSRGLLWFILKWGNVTGEAHKSRDSIGPVWAIRSPSTEA